MEGEGGEMVGGRGKGRRGEGEGRVGRVSSQSWQLFLVVVMSESRLIESE